MKEKLKNLKKKIDDNKDALIAGAYLAGASALSVALVASVRELTKKSNNARADLEKYYAEQTELLREAIDNGQPVFTFEDLSMWLTKNPHIIKEDSND